jgi:hypothetical protein
MVNLFATRNAAATPSMRSSWRRLAPIASLALLCLVLAGVVTTEWLDWQDRTIPPAQPPAAAPAPSATVNFTMPALTTYSEVLSRPLFSPNRRPSEEEPVVMVPMSMTLVAILISPRGPHALVRHGTPPQIDRVVEGQIIDGWTAEAIKFDRVILHRGAEVQELVPVSSEQPHPPPVPSNPNPNPNPNPNQPQPVHPHPR